MKKTVLGALVCSCFLAMPAHADKGYGHKEGRKGGYESYTGMMMEKMDRNRDNIITMDEHEAYNAIKFAKMDRNDDRRLTETEISDYKYSRKDGHDKGYNQ